MPSSSAFRNFCPMLPSVRRLTAPVSRDSGETTLPADATCLGFSNAQLSKIVFLFVSLSFLW